MKPSLPALDVVTASVLDRDPYPVLAALRDAHPVAWIPDLDMWFVTRRADVLTVLRDPATFSTESDQSLIADIFGPQMLSCEGARHRDFKSQCAGPFNASAVQDHLHTIIRPNVERLIRALPANGVSDLRGSVATPLSVSVVCTVLGLPAELSGAVMEWYAAFRAALANFARQPDVRDRGRHAAATFRSVVGPLLSSPGERAARMSLLATLSSRDDGRLTDDEILSNALIVLFGGIETTESALLNLLWALLLHPEHLAAIRADETLIPGALNEALRWEPAVQSCTRFATSETSIGKVPIRQGEIVQCMIGAANRDPAWYVDPDLFDIRRANAHTHLSFGSGSHFCLGAAVARAEMSEVLIGLLTRYANLDLVDQAGAAPRGLEFRAPPALLVALKT